MVKNKHLDLAIENGAKFILNYPSIVKDIFRSSSYNDEPKLYNYSSCFSVKTSRTKSEEAIATGISFNKKRALIKCIGETIERHALGLNDKSRFINEAYKDLKELALNPHDLDYFIDKGKQLPELFNKKINWIQGISLTKNKKIFVPAQLVYVPYIGQESEPTIQFSISTGAAAGTKLEDAICRGIFELIERDSFMIHYLNKLNSPLIDLENFGNAIKKILKIIKRYKLEIYVADTTTDLNIPAVAAILIDRTGIGAAVSIGLRAGFNIEEIIINAIEESLMTRSWTRDEFSNIKKEYKPKRIIRKIEDRAFFWFRQKSIEHLDFWLKGKYARKDINTRTNKLNFTDSLEKLIRIFKQRNIEMIYVDITQDYVTKYGFRVVKVIVPQLQPLYLDEAYPYLGGKRLYETPILMGGYFNKEKRRSQLNKIPHPIL